MTFSELPERLQGKISFQLRGKELWELSKSEETNLDKLTPYEMFDAWLKYEGIVGFNEDIITNYNLMFGRTK